MADWKIHYKEILCTPDEAVRSIKDHDRVLVAGAAGRPVRLVKALVDNAEMFHDVKIQHGLSHGGEDYCDEKYRDNFTHESLFVSKTTRTALEEGRARFIPCYYYELPYWYEEGVIPVNVFMFQATPPNRYGFVSCGVIADFIQEAVEAADVVIVQLNDQIPWSDAPDCLVHMSRIDRAVEFSEALPCIEPPEITETEKTIGRYCASLVNDGDTIQIGIGSIPDAVCSALAGKKDLGVHSELISDGLMNLWKSGAVTNRYKSTGRGTMTAAFALGSASLYRFLDHNPAVTLESARYTNSPFEVARCRNLASINTCIEADLMGQVVAGSYGLRNISGSGGLMDFATGCYLAHDGNARSIMAMTSTHTKNGQVLSRIKSFITDGSAVTLTRQDVDYFVTEYGIASLKGKNLKDRARALIEIAHPDFRPELIKDYERRFKSAY